MRFHLFKALQNNLLGRVMTIKKSIIIYTQDLNTVPIIKIRLKIEKVPTRGQYLR